MQRALNTGICIQQGDLFYSAGQHRKKLGEVLEKMQVNALAEREEHTEADGERHRQSDRQTQTGLIY